MNKPAEKVIRFPITEREFGLAGQRYRSFSAVLPAEYEVADIENPEVWVHVARKMQAGDEIRAMAEDMSWLASCIVLSAVGSNAQVKVLSIHALDAVKEDKSPDRYVVKFRGSIRKFGLLDSQTGEFIKDGIPSKLQAMQELEDYLKALER